MNVSIMVIYTGKCLICNSIDRKDATVSDRNIRQTLEVTHTHV